MHRNDNTQVNLPRLFNLLGSAGALACALALTGCYGAPSVAGQGAGIDKRDGTLLSAAGARGAGC